MSTIKLTYFDIPARGEPIRLALAIGRIPHEAVRIKFADWAPLKPTTPYGQLPVMEIDGHTVTQSIALFRYVAKKAGLYPTCDLQALLVDEIVDVVTDFRQTLFKGVGGNSLREERAKCMEELFPRYIAKLEKRLQERDAKGEWLVGGKVTMADVYVTCLMNEFKSGFFKFIPKDAFDHFPRMNACYEAVMNMDAVRKYHKEHPVENPTYPFI